VFNQAWQRSPLRFAAALSAVVAERKKLKVKIRIYPRISELMKICRLVFSTKKLQVRANCLSNEASTRILQRIGKKESVDPYLPPVVITEAETGMFAASIRSDQLFGVSLRLQNSPELLAEIKSIVQGTEITIKFCYTSTFKMRLLALTFAVIAILIVAHFFLLLIFFGEKDGLVIGPGGLLVSIPIFRQIMADVENTSAYEDVLLKWLHSIFPEAE